MQPLSSSSSSRQPRQHPQGLPPQDESSYVAEAGAAVAAENWTDAILITTKGRAWFPDNADLLSLQGYSLRKTGDYQKAVGAVSRAILLGPKAIRYANRGYAYLALNNFSAALADAQAGLALDAKYTAN